MLQVASAVASATPAVMDAANKAVSIATDGRVRSVKDYVKRGFSGNPSNDAKFAAEKIVKAGFPALRLRNLMDGLGVPNAQEIYQHLVDQKIADTRQMLAENTHSTSVAESYPGERVDNTCKILKEAIQLLGVGTIDNFLTVAQALENITIEDVVAYKAKGSTNPSLGYY